MELNTPQLVLPVTLCNPNAAQKENNSNVDHFDSLFHASCSSARPTSLVSWGMDAKPDLKEPEVSRCGVAMGCEDGTLYLFQADQKYLHEKEITNKYGIDANTSHTDARQSRDGKRSSLHLPHSSSPSPSSSRTNLGIMAVPKPRAVSGLSKERVEAPKNYVDFDEEEEKLRDMLKDRGAKERSIIDSLNLMPNFEKPFAIEKHNRPVFRSTRSTEEAASSSREAGLPSPPAVMSPPTPASGSSPPSPTPIHTPSSNMGPIDNILSLNLTAFVPTSGRGYSLNCLKVINNGQNLATLHVHG